MSDTDWRLALPELESLLKMDDADREKDGGGE
jgi:hypothetical protein